MVEQAVILTLYCTSIDRMVVRNIIEGFAAKLDPLPMSKGASARGMNLSLGQSAGYINDIENGYNLPSMSSFFCICEYLRITPVEFFDADSKYPQKLDGLVSNLKHLNKKQLGNISSIVEDLLQK